MNHNFKWVASASIAAISTLMMGSGAIAQEARPRVETETFPVVSTDLIEQMDEVFYSNDQTYNTNRGIPRQISSFIGASFLDHEINEDGRLVHEFVTQLWEEQAKSGPLIRTPDLPNPYQSSLLLEPTIAVEEFPDTFVRQPIPAPPVRVAPPVVASPVIRPIQALW